MNHDYLSIAATGVQVTTGAASAVTAIPNDSSGKVARYVRLQSLATCYVRPGGASTTCTVNDVLLSPNDDMLLNVAGCTHIAHLQDTAAAKFNITPVEA